MASPLLQSVITTSQIRMEASKKQTFLAKGIDRFANDFNIDGVILSATWGEIGVDGVFDAGDDKGDFIIQASTSGLT